MTAFVFDLDGTLVESAPGIFASMRHTLESMGREAPGDEELRRLIGPPTSITFAKLLGGEEHVETTVAAYRAHYSREGVLASELFPGIEASLQRLKEEGHTLFVCTSKLETFAHAILDRLAIMPLFKAIYGESGNGEHKPELLGRLVAEQNVDPARAVMIGDRREDVIAGKANGLATLGVLWGYGSAEELTEAGATAICEAADDLPAALGAL